MELRINELAEKNELNMSQVQRQSGLTMTQLRRYWYNQTKSVELESLCALVEFFQKYDPDVQPGDLFKPVTHRTPAP
jgi:DNA-binding Xre family transcriptional regulator